MGWGLKDGGIRVLEWGWGGIRVLEWEWGLEY